MFRRKALWSLIGIVSMIVGTATVEATTTVFQDNFEDNTAVPGIPDSPQVGSYPTTAPLIPEGNVVEAGVGGEPAAPAGGSNILKIFGKQRNYGEFTAPVSGASTLIRFEFDARMDASTTLAFGLVGDAAGASLDAQPASIWLQLTTNSNLAAYNGGWQVLPDVSYTLSEWQHYVLEYELESSEFTLTAGGDTVVSSHLNGVSSVSQITHIFFQGGTNTIVGYYDNMEVTVVPEPASLMLIAAAMPLLLRRRS